MNKVNNPVLEEKVIELRNAIMAENFSLYHEQMKEFQIWLESLENDVKMNILPKAIGEIQLLMKEVQEKMNMYESLRLNENSKQSANNSYGQY